MIKRLPNKKFILYSADGSRRLSKPGTLKEVLKRERQVQYFKHLTKRGK